MKDAHAHAHTHAHAHAAPAPAPTPMPMPMPIESFLSPTGPLSGSGVSTMRIWGRILIMAVWNGTMESLHTSILAQNKHKPYFEAHEWSVDTDSLVVLHGKPCT